jgi:nucleotide-binding universal stress UspA family protein
VEPESRIVLVSRKVAQWREDVSWREENQETPEVRNVPSASQGQLEFDSLADVRSILVPINGTPVTLGALHLAARLAQLNKGKVFAIYVIEVARHLPLEAELPGEIERSEAIFARAQETLRDRNSIVEFALLQARNAGATIVDEAVNIQADVILLGVADKHHTGDVALGSTSDFILKHAPCQVWLCRAPLTPARSTSGTTPV